MKENALSIGLLWLRALAGAGIAHHGYGKIFGGQVTGLAEGVAQMGFPMPLAFAWAAALSEFAGGILLVLGLGTRYAAFFIFCTMSAAAFIHHRMDPLQVKELALAYWTIAGALILTGAGKFSVDGRGKCCG
ncbi:MAG: DoxX family protein [Candidatus Omnitrophica bacterium]|nr:DoxX family protein [Candidatus Omnitrophota bacterium]